MVFSRSIIIMTTSLGSFFVRRFIVKSTNSLMYGKKLLKPIKRNGKYSLPTGIADKHDYIKVILTGAGTSHVGELPWCLTLRSL